MDFHVLAKRITNVFWMCLYVGTVLSFVFVSDKGHSFAIDRGHKCFICVVFSCSFYMLALSNWHLGPCMLQGLWQWLLSHGIRLCGYGPSRLLLLAWSLFVLAFALLHACLYNWHLCCLTQEVGQRGHWQLFTILFLRLAFAWRL